MRRVLIPLLASLPLATIAAPIPKDRPTSDTLYFATTVGCEWVYEHWGKRENLVVTDVRTVADTKVVTVSSGRRLHQVVTVSHEGVVCSQLGEYQLSPPIWLLRVQEKGAPMWARDLPARLPAVKVRAMATRLERVVVPADTFFALRVDNEYEDGDIKGRWTEWYAAGVGLVKWKGEDGEKVLISFTAGK